MVTAYSSNKILMATTDRQNFKKETLKYWLYIEKGHSPTVKRYLIDYKAAYE